MTAHLGGGTPSTWQTSDAWRAGRFRSERRRTDVDPRTGETLWRTWWACGLCSWAVQASFQEGDRRIDPPGLWRSLYEHVCDHALGVIGTGAGYPSRSVLVGREESGAGAGPAPLWGTPVDLSERSQLDT